MLLSRKEICILFWCLGKRFPTPLDLIWTPVLIFANFNSNTCKIFKYILSIKGILITLCVREVYSRRKINEFSLNVGINNAKLHLTFKYGFPNLHVIFLNDFSEHAFTHYRKRDRGVRGSSDLLVFLRNQYFWEANRRSS